MSFTAKYEGRCARNNDRIYRGDEVEYDSNGKIVHVECDEEADARADMSDLDRDAQRPVCPRCYLLQPCGCDD